MEEPEINRDFLEIVYENTFDAEDKLTMQWIRERIVLELQGTPRRLTNQELKFWSIVFLPLAREAFEAGEWEEPLTPKYGVIA